MAKKPAPRSRIMKEKKEFDEEVLQVDRVTRVVKGGRRLRFRATVIIGNRKGKVAVGTGKATEISEAIKKAVTKAKKAIITVPIIKDTLPFEVRAKYKASRLLMLPASPGTGMKAGSATRKILELAGVHNILAKSLGSNNRINLAKATLKALMMLHEKQLPEEAFRAAKEPFREERRPMNHQHSEKKHQHPKKTEEKRAADNDKTE
ncbi:MAG: 30S ribosomal protein S5 [bacterium]|nr:30S ribosomal protein S5 [bacterium]